MNELINFLQANFVTLTIFWLEQEQQYQPICTILDITVMAIKRVKRL